MNKIEKIVHGMLRSNPLLKTMVRNLYQSFFDLLPVKSFTTSHNIISVEGYFYGFHDHSPFSSNNKNLLVHKSPGKKFMPHIGDQIEFGYLAGDKFQDFVPVGRTNTWNWHMGSKLQWVGSSRKIAVNDFEAEPIVRIIDVDTLDERQVPGFMSSVSPNEKFYIGYDFIRLEQLMPGYGFKLLEPDRNLAKCEGSLHVSSLETGEAIVTLDLIDIRSFQSLSEMDNAYHFVTHGIFSPDSKKVSFFHRWISDPNNPAKRRTRLIVLDIATKRFSVMPTNGLVSHYCWADSKTLIAFCSTEDMGVGYHVFSLDEEMSVNKLEFLSGINEDGHPMVGKRSNLMVTDTYPNRRRMQSLYIYNFQENETTKMGEFYMPKKFQSPDPFHHWCCDLHPRWDRLGKMVCFDTVYTGTRSISIMDVSELVD